MSANSTFNYLKVCVGVIINKKKNKAGTIIFK